MEDAGDLAGEASGDLGGGTGGDQGAHGPRSTEAKLGDPARGTLDLSSLVKDRTSVARLMDPDLEGRARRIVSKGTPENTKRAYRSDLRYVGAWCALTGLDPDLPYSAETMVRFLVDHFEGPPRAVDEGLVRGGFKRVVGPHAVSTISRRLAAVAVAHNVAGLPNPCADPRLSKLAGRARVAAALDGWSPCRKTAAPLETLDLMLATCGDDARGVRDRAMILFGWASGGRRRSEISAARFERLTRLGEEFTYDLGVTKTDQEGDAGAVPVAGRAAVALGRWIAYAGIDSGPLFRPVDNDGRVLPTALSDKGVARVVKKRVMLAGLDPAKYGGHSLRSGFMTESGLQNVPLAEAMAMSKHRTVQVANGYHQAGHGLKNRAARIGG